MLKILNESQSLKSVEEYLTSQDLYNYLTNELGKDYVDNYSDAEVFDVIRMNVESLTDFILKRSDTVVIKVFNDDIDIIDQIHTVVSFNGKYYDYTAQKYNIFFDNLIKSSNIPVVQNVIQSDSQISPNVSSIKGYVLLGHMKGDIQYDY